MFPLLCLFIVSVISHLHVGIEDGTLVLIGLVPAHCFFRLILFLTFSFHGVQRRIISVDIFFVFLRLLFFALHLEIFSEI